MSLFDNKEILAVSHNWYKNYCEIREMYSANPSEALRLLNEHQEHEAKVFETNNLIFPKIVQPNQSRFTYNYLKVDSNGVAYVFVKGALDNNPDYFDEKYFGIINSTKLLMDIENAKNDTSVKQLIFFYNSPGGTVAGTPELAKAIYSFQKPNYGVVIGMCCSAAIWIAVNHKDIFVTSLSATELGSVGVIMVHRERSEQLKMDGLNFTVITNTDSEAKKYGNPYEPLSEAARKSFVMRADAIYEEFKANILKNYPNTPKEFLTGGIFSGKESINFGIVKGLKQINDFLNMKDEKNDGSGGANVQTPQTVPTANAGSGGGVATDPAANTPFTMESLAKGLSDMANVVTNLVAGVQAKQASTDASIDELKESIKQINAKLGITATEKTINLEQQADGSYKPDFKSEKPPYHSPSNVPDNYAQNFAANKLNKVLEVLQTKARTPDEFSKIYSAALKSFKTAPFPEKFYSANAFDPTKFQQVMGDFQELYAFEWQNALPTYGTFRTMRGFLGVVNQIVLGKFFSGSFLSPVSQSDRDIELIKTDAKVLKVEIVAGRTKMRLWEIRQSAMAYVSKPQSNDPHFLDAFWQYAIFKGIYTSIQKDLEMIVHIGQRGKYPVVDQNVANPLNACDGLITQIYDNLQLVDPDVGLYATGALTVSNIYQKMLEMLQTIDYDVMTGAVGNDYAAIYMNKTTFYKYQEAVKNEFKSAIFYDSYKVARVYGFEDLRISINPYLPNDAIIIDPFGVMAWGTNTESDHTNIKVQPFVADIIFYLETCIGAAIIDFYLGDKDGGKHLLWANDQILQFNRLP